MEFDNCRPKYCDRVFILYLLSARVRVGEYDLDKEKEGQEDCDEEGYCAPLPQV